MICFVKEKYKSLRDIKQFKPQNSLRSKTFLFRRTNYESALFVFFTLSNFLLPQSFILIFENDDLLVMYILFVIQPYLLYKTYKCIFCATSCLFAPCTTFVLVWSHVIFSPFVSAD